MSEESVGMDHVGVERSVSLPKQLQRWISETYFPESLTGIGDSDRLLLYGGLAIVGGLAMVVLSFVVNPMSFVVARAILYTGGAVVYAGIATWFVHATLLSLGYLHRIERRLV
ncbi:MAG: hypothetical protein ABEH60_03630 [Halonotius sp.]